MSQYQPITDDVCREIREERLERIDEINGGEPEGPRIQKAMTTIPMTPVHSGLIKEDGYDEQRERLAIQFHNGDTWEYPVSPDINAAYQTAESKGKYFLKTIKPNILGTKVS